MLQPTWPSASIPQFFRAPSISGGYILTPPLHHGASAFAAHEALLGDTSVPISTHAWMAFSPLAIAAGLKSAKINVPPEQQTPSRPTSAGAAITSDHMLYRIAAILHEHDADQRERFWHSSHSPEALLFRSINDMCLPCLARTHVRREMGSAAVRGACFGASRTRHSTTRASQLTFKTSLGQGHDTDIERALLHITSSIALQHPLFKYTSIQINQGLRATMHIDSANVGPSLFCELGPFFGGGLWECGTSLCGAAKVLSGHLWQPCNGRRPHVTLPFHGQRISIIAFTSDAASNLSHHPGSAHVPTAIRLGFPLPTCQDLDLIIKENHDLSEGQRQYDVFAEIIAAQACRPISQLAACAADTPTGSNEPQRTSPHLPRSITLFLQPLPPYWWNKQRAIRHMYTSPQCRLRSHGHPALYLPPPLAPCAPKPLL